MGYAAQTYTVTAKEPTRTIYHRNIVGYVAATVIADNLQTLHPSAVVTVERA